jgi:hypothetical protein
MKYHIAAAHGFYECGTVLHIRSQKRDSLRKGFRVTNTGSVEIVKDDDPVRIHCPEPLG